MRREDEDDDDRVWHISEILPLVVAKIPGLGAYLQQQKEAAEKAEQEERDAA